MRRHTFYTLLITTIAFLFACTSTFASAPPPHKPIKGFYIGQPKTAALAQLNKHLATLRTLYPDAYIHHSRLPVDNSSFFGLVLNKKGVPKTPRLIQLYIACGVQITDSKVSLVTLNPPLFDVHSSLTPTETSAFVEDFCNAYDVILPYSHNDDGSYSCMLHPTSTPVKVYSFAKIVPYSIALVTIKSYTDEQLFGDKNKSFDMD